MLPTIQCLLDGIIDYAGLFPPARLDLKTAIERFAAYRSGPHAWMLARFVCPTARMAELQTVAGDLFTSTEHGPWRFSALGRSGKTANAFVTGLEDDLAAIREFEAIDDGRVVVDLIETRLPNAVVESDDATAAADLIERTSHVMEVHKGIVGKNLRIFLEIPFGKDWRNTVAHTLSAMAEHNRTHAEARRHDEMPDAATIGAKIRTGGIEASMIPPIEQVAMFIDRCRVDNVPFKATAGLHHPLRHHSAEVDAKMHGFLNVFVAAGLARLHVLDQTELAEILGEESRDGFRFDETGISWGEHTMSTEQIHPVRSHFACSFGSCSLEEPVDDLRQLDLL